MHTRRQALRGSIGVLVVALVVGGVCVRLGVWQLSRLHQRNEFVAAVERGLSAAPVPIERVLPPAGEVNADLARYRRVEVSGTYDTSREVVLYGRGSTGDTNGNHVLTPLVMHDGSGIVVDRGWVPIGDNVPPVEAAAPPHGAVELTGILLPSEGGLPGEGGGSRVTETTHVDLAQLASQMPYGLEPLYLLLQSQRPPQVSLPRIAPFRLPSAPPHLSYAIQWFFFAAIAFVGGAVLARREPDGPPPVTNDRRAGGVENAETEAR